MVPIIRRQCSERSSDESTRPHEFMTESDSVSGIRLDLFGRSIAMLLPCSKQKRENRFTSPLRMKYTKPVVLFPRA